MALSDDLFSQSQNFLNQASPYLIPSYDQYEKAANRVTSRLGTEQQSLEGQIKDRYAGRGLSQSGLRDTSLLQSQIGAQSALGSQLGELESDFSRRQQEGANILGQFGTQLGQTGANIFGTESSYKLGSEQNATERARQQADEAYQAGQLGLGAAGVETERKANLQKALNDFFLGFGTFGNLPAAEGVSDEFVTNFNSLLEQIFGNLGA